MKRALPYLWITAAFVVACLVVGLVTNEGLHLANGPATPDAEQAWFSNPAKVNPGVYANRTLDITVHLGAQGTTYWELLDAGTVLQTGTVVGRPGTTSTFRISTAHAKYHTWLQLTVLGIKDSLQVWVI